MEDYSKLSIEALRELLLEDKLLREFLYEDDYTALMDNEAELDEPDEKVIDFCFTGLSALPKYENIRVRDFDVDDLEKLFKKRYSPKKPRKIKRVFVTAATLIFMLLVTQLVASAFGFDFFGYILNWNKPEVIEITNPNITDNDNEDFEDLEIEYSSIDEVPIEMKQLISEYLLNNFKFSLAAYIKRDNVEKNMIYFLDKNENTLLFNIENAPNFNIEKDNGGYYEEYLFNDTLFMIFTNTDDYGALWIQDEYVYTLYTHFDNLQDLKNILNNIS